MEQENLGPFFLSCCIFVLTPTHKNLEQASALLWACLSTSLCPCSGECWDMQPELLIPREGDGQSPWGKSDLREHSGTDTLPHSLVM